MTPVLTISPAGAAGTYARADAGFTTDASGGGFGDVLHQALGSVVASGHAADAQAMQAISGKGNLTEVVTAVSQAELAMQSAIAVRDRVVQAYQDIMRMPI